MVNAVKILLNMELRNNRTRIYLYLWDILIYTYKFTKINQLKIVRELNEHANLI